MASNPKMLRKYCFQLPADQHADLARESQACHLLWDTEDRKRNFCCGGKSKWHHRLQSRHAVAPTSSTDVSCVLLQRDKPSPCPAIYAPKYIYGFQHSFLFFSSVKTRYLHLSSSVGFLPIYEGLTLEQWIYPLLNPLSFGDSTAGSTNQRKTLDLVSALMSSAGKVFYFFFDLHWLLW